MFIEEPSPVDNSSNYESLSLIGNLEKPSLARTPEDLIDVNINRYKDLFTKEGALTLAQIAYFSRMDDFSFDSVEISSGLQEMYNNKNYRGYEISLQDDKFYLICKKGSNFKLKKSLNNLVNKPVSSIKKVLDSKSKVKGWIGLNPVCMFFVDKEMYLDFLKVLSLKNGA